MTPGAKGSHVCIGELLIDLVAVDATQTVERATLFRKAAGGAPANVAVGLARLGCQAALIGKVADDAFGRYLRSTLEREGVQTSGLATDHQARTPLAFVGAGEASERSFVFYHRGMADTTLRYEEVDLAMIERARVVHFGSVMLTAEPGRTTTIRLVNAARAAGTVVTFDPNIRVELWDDVAEAVAVVRSALAFADVVKLSVDEMRLVTGHDDPASGAADLRAGGAALVIVTLGADGAYFVTGTGDGYVAPFDVDVVDSTGAGDGFMAGLLCAMSSVHDPMAAITDRDSLHRAVEFANAAGALTTTGYGAIPSLPRAGAVTALINEQPAPERARRFRRAYEPATQFASNIGQLQEDPT